MPDYAALTNSELVQRLRTGDEAAFTEIYNRYWEKLLAIGYHYSHQKQVAEDIVHDVLTSLWARRAAVDIHALEAWLATAVKFAVFKAIARERKRRDEAAGLPAPSPFATAEEKLEAVFLQQQLHAALDRLPQKTKLIFHYSREEALSVSRIARKMDLSPKAVEYHLTRALRALKEQVGKIKSFFI